MANVKLSELSKFFGKSVAVDNISLEIKEGEFFLPSRTVRLRKINHVADDSRV